MPEVNYEHEKIVDADEFDKRSFRTITIKEGVKATIGCPKGKWNDKKKACKVGTKLQKLMREK